MTMGRRFESCPQLKKTAFWRGILSLTRYLGDCVLQADITPERGASVATGRLSGSRALPDQTPLAAISQLRCIDPVNASKGFYTVRAALSPSRLWEGTVSTVTIQL